MRTRKYERDVEVIVALRRSDPSSFSSAFFASCVCGLRVLLPPEAREREVRKRRTQRTRKKTMKGPSVAGPRLLRRRAHIYACASIGGVSAIRTKQKKFVRFFPGKTSIARIGLRRCARFRANR